MSNIPIVFYDGVCGLCNRTVQFVIARDKKQRFRFATLQSDFAQQTLGVQHTFDSFVFYENGKAHFKSTAALKLLKTLGGLWSLLYVLIVVPPFIRNAVYDWVARNRYQWFGKYDSCPIPSAEQRALFLD